MLCILFLLSSAVFLHGFELVSEQLKNWHRQGLLILRGAFDSNLMRKACSEFEYIWHPNFLWRPKLWLEVTPRGAYQANRTLFLRSLPAYFRMKTYRIKDPVELKFWRDIAEDERLLKLVRLLIGQPARLVSSLLFERGSQQALHEDTWYNLASEQPDGVVGVWLALEDVHSAAGPLVYVPGSHKRHPYVPVKQRHDRSYRARLAFPWPISAAAPPEVQQPYYDDAAKWMADQKIEAQPFLANAGDIMIWSERLLHGGSPIKDLLRTRRSIVFHYRVDAVYDYVVKYTNGACEKSHLLSSITSDLNACKGACTNSGDCQFVSFCPEGTTDCVAGRASTCELYSACDSPALFPGFSSHNKIQRPYYSAIAISENCGNWQQALWHEGGPVPLGKYASHDVCREACSASPECNYYLWKDGTSYKSTTQSNELAVWQYQCAAYLTCIGLSAYKEMAGAILYKKQRAV